MTLKILIDRDNCIGSGLCVDEAPKTLRLDDDGVAVVINSPGDRDEDDAVLAAAEHRLAEFLTESAAEEGCTVEIRSLARFDPVVFDDAVVELVESTATRLGHSVMRMPSGAGHDAQMLARICPTAMIFTPSRDGVSHNPSEYTEPAALAAGAGVLLHVMLALAEQSP